MTEHAVYVMGQRDGAKKIGLAKNVDNRRNFIQCAAPFRVEVLAIWIFPTLQTAFAVEQLSHVILQGDRIYGEWFSTGIEDIIADIDSAAGLVEEFTVYRAPGTGREALWNRIVNIFGGEP